MSAVPWTRRKGGSPARTWRIGDASRRSARASSSSSDPAEQALERRAEPTAAVGVGLEVHRREERHDGGDARVVSRAHRGRGDEVPAGRLPQQRDPLRVDPQASRVRFHPEDRRLHVLDRRRVAVLRRQAIVDREPRHAGAGQGLEQGTRGPRPIPARPAAAVHEERGREGPATRRDAGVEPQRTRPPRARTRRPAVKRAGGGAGPRRLLDRRRRRPRRHAPGRRRSPRPRGSSRPRPTGRSRR